MFGADHGAAGTNFGVGSQQDVEELNKALTAGYGRGGSQADGALGAPLRVESLEATLKVTTYNERHIVFWKDIPKLPAFNTVEEFNQLNAYGNSGGYFVAEGVAPQESDSSYARKTVQVKYVGSLRKVTHQMTLVRPAHGDVIALETMNGTREILRTVEEALFRGDSSCVSVEWDGIEKQFTDGNNATEASLAAVGTMAGTENIIDLRGEPLSEAVLGDASRVLIDNFGFATALYCGYETMTDLNNTFLARERIPLGQAPLQQGAAGFALQQYVTAGGSFGFRPSVFLKPGEGLPTAAVGVGPTLGTASVAGAAGASTDSILAAGTYKYSVVFENAAGRTTAITSANVVATAGQTVTLTITPGTLTGATAMRIFRSTGTAGTGAIKFIKRVPYATTFLDKGYDIPGTSKAYLLQVDLDVMSFKQLAPFTKIPLATIDPAIRWMQLLYGTPALYAPKRMVLIKNIGKAS